MSRIFLSHSSANGAEAIALRDWLVGQGWDDIFLDLDPERGIKAGERWQEALKRAAERCELIFILVSPAWASSKWCLAEFLFAKSFNKRIFGVIIEPTPFSELPAEMTEEWHVVDLTAGARDYETVVTLPPSDKTAAVAFAQAGLNRLRIGLLKAGLDARFFAWPPEDDRQRAPYPGLRPLENEDAGIFFGRDGSIVLGLDLLRGLREAIPPRLMVVLGASGAGKSSFVRAGLHPRLARDDQHFLPLPVVRPERAVMTGETGLIASLEMACKEARVTGGRDAAHKAVDAGGSGVAALLASFIQARMAMLTRDDVRREPTLVLCVDQAEELFLADGAEEARTFLQIVRDLAARDDPAVIVLFTIRSDSYERLQTARELEAARQHTLSLPPMPQGAYADVIKGPARRLEGSDRPLRIEEQLVDALLADIEAGGAKDALPLLAFTLERLHREQGSTGHLTLKEYDRLGRIKGSIEAAVEQALVAADDNPDIPRDRSAKLALLRLAMIPWLAGIDPETGSPRRRIARRSELPDKSRALVELLIEQRLLSTDIAKDTGEGTVEPAHEALLRQWDLLQSWLTEDAALLGVLEGVKRAAKDWSANNMDAGWLTHVTGRLDRAERLQERADLAASLDALDLEYLMECRKRQDASTADNLATQGRTRRMRMIVAVLAFSVLAGLAYAGWANRPYLRMQTEAVIDTVWSSALSPKAELALAPSATFKECSSCPTMVVVPAGEFMMGTDKFPTEAPHLMPVHKVAIPRPFAVAMYETTFDEWDACVAHGGCKYSPGDSGWGRGKRPVINISWDETKEYVVWLSAKTGKPYRLLTEAEFEYAARAGSQTTYYWGDTVGVGNAHCRGCNPEKTDATIPVGSFQPNPFGLFDMLGNAAEWVQDPYVPNYNGAPTDGSAVTTKDETREHRVMRGGSWGNVVTGLNAADRGNNTRVYRDNILGFRVARSLNP